MYDWPRLRANLLAVTVTGALLGWFGGLVADWRGTLAAMVVFSVAWWLALRDARLDEDAS